MERLTGLFVALVRRYLPDPFVYATLLTLVAFVGAWIAGPAETASPPNGPWISAVLAGWFGGVFKILEFAMQMVLVLVAGHSLASTPLVRRALASIAARARTPSRALALTVSISLAACWLNWGFGLVVAGLLAREMARAVRGLDFPLCVAAAYSGFVVWASGLSSSIALSSATPGSAVNFIEKTTHQVAPLRETVFAPFNLVPVVVMAVVLPVIFSRLRPAGTPIELGEQPQESNPVRNAVPEGLAGALERLPLTTAIGLLGLAHLVSKAFAKTLAPDLNTVILTFIVLGMLLQPKALDYVRAWNEAAKSVGPLLLQYPIYGGIMGLISTSSLVERLAHATEMISNRHTFAPLVFLSSNVISFFVPSGGGHWAVQGPIVLPAALKLGVSPAVAAMAVAVGEQTANMVQPFWALPLLAIAGLGVRDVMGYCVLTYLISIAVFGAALFLLA
jgi:short-chain fatty acids transporter